MDQHKSWSDADLSGLRPYLDGIEFPISKEDLLTTLQRRGAPEPLLIRLGAVHIHKFDSALDVLARVQPR